MQQRRLYFVKQGWEGCERKDGKSLLLIVSRKETLIGELETGKTWLTQAVSKPASFWGASRPSF